MGVTKTDGNVFAVDPIKHQLSIFFVQDTENLPETFYKLEDFKQVCQIGDLHN